MQAVCSEKSANYLNKDVANINRQMIARHSTFTSKLFDIKNNLSDDAYANARLFVCLAISNLTMCEEVVTSSAELDAVTINSDRSSTRPSSKSIEGEDVNTGAIKAELLTKLGIEFFLPPRASPKKEVGSVQEVTPAKMPLGGRPDKGANLSGSAMVKYDAIVERTCMLCLSELFESDSNRSFLKWEAKDWLLEALNNAGKSADLMSVQLAVKALSLLTQPKSSTDKKDRDCIARTLLENGVLETFYHASKRIRNLYYLNFAFVGMMNLSADVESLLEHGVADCEEGALVPDASFQQVLKCRVVSWVLFVKTLSTNDTFFSRPISIESPHPLALGGFEATVHRPGATAVVVNIRDAYFSKDLARKEELVLYNSAKKEVTSVDSILSVSVSNAEPRYVFTDNMHFEIRHADAPGAPGWGCRLKVSPVFGKHVFLLPETNSTRKAVETAVEYSDHPIVLKRTERATVELMGVSAYSIAFHPDTAIRSTDKLVFHVEDGAGGFREVCTLTNRVSARGTWPTTEEPLIISGRKIFYEFIPGDEAASEYVKTLIFRIY